MSLGLEDKMALRITEKKVTDLGTSVASLVAAIRKDEQADAKIVAALQQNNQAFNVFLGKFKEYLEQEKKPEEPPQVNVTTNQELVVSAIEGMNKLLGLIANNQKSIIELVGKKPTRLNVTRNDYGTIKYVEIQY